MAPWSTSHFLSLRPLLQLPASTTEFHLKLTSKKPSEQLPRTRRVTPPSHIRCLRRDQTLLFTWASSLQVESDTISTLLGAAPRSPRSNSKVCCPRIMCSQNWVNSWQPMCPRHLRRSRSNSLVEALKPRKRARNGLLKPVPKSTLL